MKRLPKTPGFPSKKGTVKNTETYVNGWELSGVSEDFGPFAIITPSKEACFEFWRSFMEVEPRPSGMHYVAIFENKNIEQEKS